MLKKSSPPRWPAMPHTIIFPIFFPLIYMLQTQSQMLCPQSETHRKLLNSEIIQQIEKL